MPVWREVLADLETPLSAFVKLVGDREGFLLESVEHAERWGRFSFLGRDPARTFVVRGRDVEWLGGDAARRRAVAIRARSPRSTRCSRATARRRSPELPPFHGGIVGWLGYDTVREIERLPNVPDDDLGSRRRGAARSRVRSRRSTTSASAATSSRTCTRRPAPTTSTLDALYDDAVERLDSRGRRARPAAAVPARAPAGRRARPSSRRCAATSSADAWAEAVEAAKEHILDGDIFQVVLAQRFDLVEPVDPFAVYRVLRLVNPSPYMYFLRHPEATIVGSSPEPMVQLRDGPRDQPPIAGTRRRGRDEQHDKRLAAELVEHPKERAEHVMLVDLARNDVGRVVQFGTEQVEELMTLERYSHVMHLTSQVAGDLARRQGTGRRAAGDVPGRAPSAARRRCGRWRSSTSSNRRSAGPYAGRRRLRRLLGQPRHRDRDPDDGLARTARRRSRPVPGSSPTPIPADEDLECRNKAQALLTAAAAAQRICRRRCRATEE